MHFFRKLRLRRKKTSVSTNGETSVAVQQSPARSSRDSPNEIISPRVSGEIAIALPTSCTSHSVRPLPDANSRRFTSQLSDYLWAKAFEIFKNREPELMKDFKTHLSSSQEGIDPSTLRSIEPIAEGLVKRREDKQWRVQLLGKQVHIRRQIERLAKFVFWVDNAVKPILATQPYAMLAWSGASLFFLVCRLWPPRSLLG